MLRSIRPLTARRAPWDRLLARPQIKPDVVVGEAGWEVSVDSTVARTHQGVLRYGPALLSGRL